MSKRLIFFSSIFFFLFNLPAFSNSINGSLSTSLLNPASLKGEWKGALIVQMEIHTCVLNIFKEGENWKAMMDLPENKLYNIPYNISIKNDAVELTRSIDTTETKITYAGTIKKNVITGNYTYQRKNFVVEGVFQLVLNPAAVTKFQPLPAFKLNLLENNKQVDNKSFSGKYLLIDFWTTTCKVCIPKRSVLEEANNLYAGSQLEILSIALDTEAAVNTFRKEKSSMMWNNSILKDKWKDEIVINFGIDKIGLPTTILVCPEGKIVATTEELTKENLLKTLNKHLSNAKWNN